MDINNFMESLSDFKKVRSVEESETIADTNRKVKDLMDSAVEAKKNAQEVKAEYDKLQSEKADDALIEIALLKYKKFKAQAEMLAADAKLLKRTSGND